MQYLGELGAEVSRACATTRRRSTRSPPSKPERIVISPGPGRPEDAGRDDGGDPGSSGATTPILGVCLGHQAIGAVFGGSVVRAPVPMHGKTSTIEHDGRGVFSGLTAPFLASRYHSLVVADDGLPDELEVTARTQDDGIIMGLRHRTWPVHGVQFHPESILTGEGRRILRNFLDGPAGLTMFCRADRQADAARGPHERGGGRGDGRSHGGARARRADRRAS